MSARDRSSAASEWRLRDSLMLLLVLATLGTFLLVGSGVLAFRVPSLLAEERQQARHEALVLARHCEQLLLALEGRLAALAAVAPELAPAQLKDLLAATLAEGGWRALYAIDAQGRTIALAAPGGDAIPAPDVASLPLIAAARQQGQRLWAAEPRSSRAGEGGLALAVPAGAFVLLGEVAGDFVDTLLAAGDGQRANPLLVVDRAGLVVAGRMLAAADRQRNWAADLDGAGLDAGGGVRQLRLADSAYDAGVARAVPPGWTFVVASPAGHANPRVRSAILAVLGGLAAALLLAAVLAPLWAAPMNAALRDLIAQTRALTSGGRGRRVTRGPILEFNQLASDMEAMAEATRQRQAELEQSQERLVHTLQTVQRLNLELESRVTRRTADLEQANRELSEAMARLRMAQGELVRSEKLASLGNLVGGIAHELNTPIGNGVMAVSTVNEQVREFRREMSEGLRRSHLASFVDRVERGSAIALRNLQRANELILGFKQVAVDQATVQRRPFLLAEVVDEILLTMQPALRRTRCRVTIRVAPGLELDSYPGPLGQVLSNLLSNALVHGFEGRPQGLVEITAAAAGPGQICLTFADDGVGIAPDMVDRIFDPFVTSKLGRGGTGLGLHIVWSTVTAVLGGSISVSSVPGEGTRFRIILPVTAPTQPAAA